MIVWHRNYHILIFTNAKPQHHQVKCISTPLKKPVCVVLKVIVSAKDSLGSALHSISKFRKIAANSAIMFLAMGLILKSLERIAFVNHHFLMEKSRCSCGFFNSGVRLYWILRCQRRVTLAF